MPPSKRNTGRKPKRPARKRPMDHNHVIKLLLIICGIVTFGIGTGLAWFFSLDIPNIQSVDDYQPLVATTVLDRNGKVLARSESLTGDLLREPVKWTESEIADLKGQTVSVRFTLRNGRFYSYWLE